MFKIISGGQTGADRAALDAAIELGVPCGGWCPADRSGEDGVIPTKYPVTPLPSGGYSDRTRGNVQDSDGTVIISFGPPTGGSETTRRAALDLGKPLLIVDASMTESAALQIMQFVRTYGIEALNVAGPRASEQPGISAYVYEAVRDAINILEGRGG